MKNVFLWIASILLSILSLALIRERLSANLMKGFYLQALESEATWAYSYGRVLNNTNLSADEKLHKLQLVSESEITPLCAQLESFPAFGRQVPDIKDQLLRIDKK